MPPLVRLAGGVLLLALYASVLVPTPVSESRHDADSDGRPEAWLAASDETFGAGRYADALEPTSRLVERFPNQHVYRQRLAQIFEHLNRPADEAAAWEHVVEVSPTPIDACPAIGNAYRRAGDEAKALDAFERCLSFDPGNTDAMFFLGLTYYRAGRNNDTRRLVDKLLVRAPSNADVLLLAGLLSEREGRIPEARTFLERGLAVSERYVDIHIALGRVAATEGRRVEARGHFERAVELDPARKGELAVWLERTAGAR